MKSASKIFIFCMLFSLLFSVGIYAKDFSDVNSNDWYYNNVTNASNKGWITGYPDGSFRPNNNVTYAEAISMILRMDSIHFGNRGENWYDEAYIRAKVNDYFPYFYEEAYASANRYITREDLFRLIYFARDFEELDFRISDFSIFEDVSKNSEWVNVPINTLAFLDILAGYEENGKLYAKPNQLITRAELCTILSRVEGVRVNELLLKFKGETIDISPYEDYKDRMIYQKLNFEELKPKKEEPKVENPVPQQPVPQQPVVQQPVEVPNNVFVSKNVINPNDKARKDNPIQMFGYSNQQFFDIMRKSLAAGGEEIYVMVDMAVYNQSQVSVKCQELLNVFGLAARSLSPKYKNYMQMEITFEMAPNSRTVNIGTIRFTSVNYAPVENAVNDYNKLINYVRNDLTTLYSKGVLNNSMSDRDKALKLAEYISINMSYDSTLSDISHNPNGFFEGWKLTCEGYSGLFNTYLKELGIESYVVSGSAGGNHAWVISKLDGQWLMSDVTFSDPVYTYNGVLTQKFEPEYIAITYDRLKQVDSKYGTSGRYIDSEFLNYIGLSQFNK